jgi:hypothetical protein
MALRISTGSFQSAFDAAKDQFFPAERTMQSPRDRSARRFGWWGLLNINKRLMWIETAGATVLSCLP